jgi:O-6-methylguanine DNA methyltransferase
MNLVTELTNYIKEKYDVIPERPWMRYPENMTFKEKGSEKWFALIMPVAKRKLGLTGDEEIFVVNVKSDPDFIGMISQTDGYMPGYHMNKRHWLTVFLDGTVPLQQVFDRVDESYQRITDSPSKRIYEAVKKIPKGRVATYGQVAELAGDKKMARAVGNALHKNPDPSGIPCYRVVNARGELAGEFAFGGAGAQAKLLQADGIEVIDGKVDLSKYGI